MSEKLQHSVTFEITRDDILLESPRLTTEVLEHLMSDLQANSRYYKRIVINYAIKSISYQK